MPESQELHPATEPPELPAELLRRRQPNPVLAALMWAGFVALTLGMALAMVPLQLLVLPFDGDRRLSATLYRWGWGYGLFWAHPSVQMLARGHEHVGAGPYIVVSNHTSVLDIPSAHRLPVPLRVVAKHSLFRIPVVGQVMWLTGPLSLDRSGPQAMRAGLEAARVSVSRGSSLLVFPEGTRSLDGSLGAFHRGAFRMAKDLGIPVLPVVQYGSHFMLSARSLRPGTTRQRVRQVVLPPVDPADFGTARAMAARVRGAMEVALNELRTDEHTRLLAEHRRQPP